MVMQDKKVPICKRCGRRLKTPEAIDRGMGLVCWEKSRTSDEKVPLFSVTKGDKQCKE